MRITSLQKFAGFSLIAFDLARVGRLLGKIIALTPFFISPAANAADETTENLVQWRAGLSSSAQPNAAFLELAKARGYDMVINLAPPEYDMAVETEGALLAKAGVVYVNIPVAWTKPTIEDFELFSGVLKAAGKRKVLVHCQVNLRGSSFAFLYRVIHDGAPVNDSLAKLTGIWVPNPTWKKFIESVLEANGKKVDIF